jgi:hypothetical protein
MNDDDRTLFRTRNRVRWTKPLRGIPVGPVFLH